MAPSKIDTGVTSDYYAADDDGDQAEDIFNHDSEAATLPDTSRRQTGCRCRADGRNMGGYVIFQTDMSIPRHLPREIEART